jgi:hypothetical protein
LNVLAFLEADTVTGPAANLLQCHRAAAAQSARSGGRDVVRLMLAVFQRGRAPVAESARWAAADAAGVAVVLYDDLRDRPAASIAEGAQVCAY